MDPENAIRFSALPAQGRAGGRYEAGMGAAGQGAAKGGEARVEANDAEMLASPTGFEPVLPA